MLYKFPKIFNLYNQKYLSFNNKKIVNNLVKIEMSESHFSPYYLLKKRIGNINNNNILNKDDSLKEKLNNHLYLNKKDNQDKIYYFSESHSSNNFFPKK